MEAQKAQPSRVRRTINDLVMAEMFLLQATIESATAIGDGISELGRRLNAEDDDSGSWDEVTSLLRHTADEALEPYTTRFRYFRDMINSED